MKIHNQISRPAMMYLALLLVLISQTACTDDFIGKITRNAKVETLVPAFQANDGLSVDRFGTVYASSFSNFAGTEVLKVNPKTGVIGVAVDSLVAPTGNVVDKAGNIYVVNNIRRLSADSNQTKADVLKFATDGTRTVLATLPGFPSGIAIDPEGNLFVANYSLPVVHKIGFDGIATVFVQDPKLAGGVGITFDKRNNLFVGNFISGDILKISPSSTVELLATIPTRTENVVIGYITYFAGSIFATAIGENAIYRVSMDGEATLFAGNGIQATVDGSLDEASFNVPNGITADPFRKVLYVTEGGTEGALRVIRFR